MTPEQEFNRLRWRCRRGMRELDTLLLRYVERDWPRAGPAQRRAFEALLGWQDPEILELLAGRRPADNPAQHDVVQRLLTHD